jgi:hypothetical protein
MRQNETSHEKAQKAQKQKSACILFVYFVPFGGLNVFRVHLWLKTE